MRHDAHFVEELSTRSTTPIGTMLPIDQVEPNPDQPRTSLGDLEDLTSSIREKGVLEPILVRAISAGRYQIISGERRYHAACLAGLDEIPAIEMDADERETLEIALIENIQRKDLTPFEEAEALTMLEKRFQHTHEGIARVIGKSRTTVTETLLLIQIPPRLRSRCVKEGIASKSVLVQIARAGDEASMEALIDRIVRGEADRADIRKATARKPEPKSAGRPKNFMFSFKEKGAPFSLDLKFRKSEVSRDEVIAALRAILGRLEDDES